MTPEIRLARRNGRKALTTTRQGIAAFVAASELTGDVVVARARLDQADRQIAVGIAGLMDVTVALEPAILEATAPEAVPAMRARLARARQERDGEFLLELVGVFCA